MALRDVVVGWFGEGVARRIEQFVDGTVFGDDFVTCPQCRTPVAATLITERGVCPVCRTIATNDLSIEALEARKRTAMAAAQAANNEVEEIERLLNAKRKTG
jgi:uncharacterized Zn finger protein (UPF0148 family)